MGDATSRVLRVALIADKDLQGKNLKDLLEINGLSVVVDQYIGDYNPEQINKSDVDVLLVNLDEHTSHEMERLEALIEQSTVPILFNESGIPGGSGWGRKLIAKLNGLVLGRKTAFDATQSRILPAQEKSGSADDEFVVDSHDVTGVAELKTDPLSSHADTDAKVASIQASLCAVNHDDKRNAPAQRVWVLGASLGGPQALKLFLSRLPEDLSVGMILAQHIGRPFVALLAEQLNRVTGLTVMPAIHGRTVRSHEVILVPVDSRFRLTDAGVVELRDEAMRGPYRPCIDEVMEEVARCYGNQTGAIIFSGMGEDGALGAVAVNDAGGMVWAQDANSCVISSMPDSARNTGVVTFSGTPEELASRLAEKVKVQYVN